MMCVCMILPGGGSRLQTSGGLAAQLFDSTLRTSSLDPTIILHYVGADTPDVNIRESFYHIIKRCCDSK